MKTEPMPPWPICWSSLYGPIFVPGPSEIGSLGLVLDAGTAGRRMKLPASAITRSRSSTSARNSGLAAQASARNWARSEVDLISKA